MSVEFLFYPYPDGRRLSVLIELDGLPDLDAELKLAEFGVHKRDAMRFEANKRLVELVDELRVREARRTGLAYGTHPALIVEFLTQAIAAGWNAHAEMHMPQARQGQRRLRGMDVHAEPFKFLAKHSDNELVLLLRYAAARQYKQDCWMSFADLWTPFSEALASGWVAFHKAHQPAARPT